MRLHLAGSKRQAGGVPTGLRIPDAWLSCLRVGQTPAHMWRLGCCLCARHTPSHIWRLGLSDSMLKRRRGMRLQEKKFKKSTRHINRAIKSRGIKPDKKNQIE